MANLAMVCRRCDHRLTLEDLKCPGCGAVTGVEAKLKFDTSLKLGVWSIVIFVISVPALGLISQLPHSDILFSIWQFISWIPALCMLGALISLIMFFGGLRMKNYRNLSRKERSTSGS